MIFTSGDTGDSDGGYQVQRSLRFRASASASLSRTFGAATNRKKSTLSIWVKRGALARSVLFSSFLSPTDRAFLEFDESGRLNFDDFPTSQSTLKTSTRVFRDPTALLHIVLATDTDAVSAEDRVILWVNNERITSWVNNTKPGLSINPGINSPRDHYFGQTGASTGHADIYDADAYFVDGKALTPSAFGEFDTTVPTYWKPKSPAQVRAAVGGGTRNGFGTNGFYLPFSDPTSLTTLMYDRSQSDTDTTGNNWTANNISLTAGATYDSMLDVPLGGGGQERGNYCTLNPLVPSAANITNANLSSGTTPVRGTFDCSLFNSQWEVTAGASGVTAGVINEAGTVNTTTVTANKTFAFRLSTAGALDYKNITDAGSWTSITTGLSGTRFPYGTGAAASWNFGQRPLAEAVTAGYYALHTGNLTDTTPISSGSFTGNLSADGPFIWCNGTPDTLTVNGNAVTFGTHADKLATGFKLRTSSSSYNSSGTNTWIATYLSPSSKSAFKYQNAKGNP